MNYKTLFYPTNTNCITNWASLVTRITVGAIIFPHGAQKLLGWFGGYGYNGTMNYLTEGAGLPWIIAFLVIIIESLGSLALIAGLFTRLVAIGMFFLFIGIILTAHLDGGFFMNWYGQQKPEGYEYHLLVLGLSLATIISGAGKWSIDRLLFNKNN